MVFLALESFMYFRILFAIYFVGDSFFPSFHILLFLFSSGLHHSYLYLCLPRQSYIQYTAYSLQ